MKRRRVLQWGVALGLCSATSWSLGTTEDLSVFGPERIVRSTHFRVHHEDPSVPAGVLNTLEGLHARLLLDLGPFCPWAQTDPIDVYIYKNAQSYAERTGMPRWSNAYIVAERRTIHAPPGEITSDGRSAFQRVMAHELGHLFFTQFFLQKSTTPPLWLNEGVASLMEWEYGLERESDDVDRLLREKTPLPLKDLFAYSYQHAGEGDGDRVGLWYLQVQSVTRFLMRRFSRDQFVRFCGELRRGESVDAALRSAYGLAFPNTDALERLWRDTLPRRKN